MGRNAQCRSNFVERSVHRMPVVNKEFMFQRVLTVHGSLPTSVFLSSWCAERFLLCSLDALWLLFSGCAE